MLFHNLVCTSKKLFSKSAFKKLGFWDHLTSQTQLKVSFGGGGGVGGGRQQFYLKLCRTKSTGSDIFLFFSSCGVRIEVRKLVDPTFYCPIIVSEFHPFPRHYQIKKLLFMGFINFLGSTLTQFNLLIKQFF